ncbi:MAG: beta strand repeat-containing protein [Gaiellaceae bacterium]
MLTSPGFLRADAQAARPCTVLGTSGNDVLAGTPRADVLCGFGGDDVLRGLGSNDVLRGGRGDDRVLGGPGNDRLRGWGGDDSLSGGGGDDVLRGSRHSDRLSGGGGDDVLRGWRHSDSLSGGTGSDDLLGAQGNDSLAGGGGADVLRGGGAADRLDGGPGSDDLLGGDGRDRLDARDAPGYVDRLFCGPGGDTALVDAADSVGSDCENVPGNAAPTDIALSNASVAENQPAGTVVGDLTAVDPDAGDVHAFALASGAGDADNASFQVVGADVRTNVVFDYETKNSFTIRLRVVDGHGGSYEEQFTISVSDVPENANPVAVDDAYSTTEDAQLDLPTSGPGSPAENDTDADGDPLDVTAASNPSGGSVSISGGQIEFVPTPDLCGAAAGGFDYTVSDGQGGTDTGHVSVDITCVDDSPVAVDDASALNEDAAATAIDVLVNDTDPDGGPKSITATTDGSNGVVVITGSGTGLTYEPAADFCGSDSFTYRLNGGSAATVSVTVTCVNDAPSFVKGPDQANVANQNADGSPRAFTIDPWATAISAGPANESGQTVEFVIDSVIPASIFTVQPSVSATGVLSFTTDPTQTGTATIVLRIRDNGGTANGGSDTSVTQSFTIQTINPPPIAVDDSYTATGNVGINVGIPAEGVLLRGTDDTLFGATITHCGATSGTAAAVSGGTCTTTSASGGNVVLNTNGTFTYNPPPGVTGTDHFFYRLTNSAGSSVGDVSITIGDMIWFVENDAAACTALAAGCGRLSSPFSTLAAFQAVNSGAAPNPQPGDTVFLHTGSGAYTGGVALRDEQPLIGQGAGASIATISGITLAPFSNPLPATGGAHPSLTTSAAATNAITLGSGNTVRGLDIGNKTGFGIAGTNFGTLTLSEVDITGSGQALNLTTGTANATFGTLSSSSGTNGVALVGVSGSPTATGGTLTGATGDELVISGGGASFTYPGSITNTGTNRAVNITGKTGGTVALSGQITDTGGSGDGISLSGNTGATINLTGGVQLSTGAAAAFTATGGGTVNVTGASNTLATTTGTALNVANTTIGAGGLNFRSISANGGANGIVLNTTGSNGGLTVTGTGTTDGSGGTIQNTTTRGASLVATGQVSLSNMAFTNAATVDFPAAPTGLSLGNNTADNAAVHLQTVDGAALTNVDINGSAEHGINIHDVQSFSLVASSILNAGNAADEDGIHAYRLSGTSAVTNTTITSSGDDNVNIQNNTNLPTAFTNVGTINVTGGSFNTGVLGSGLLFGIRGTHSTTINIAGVTTNNNFSGGVVADTFDTATSDIEVSGSTITNNNDAIQISSNNGNTDFDIHDNPNITNQDFVNITILKAAFSTGGSLEGRIRNNPNIDVENGHTADAVSTFQAGGGSLSVVVSGNDFDYAGTQRVILAQAGQDGGGALNATITGNAIDVALDGAGNAVTGILAQAAIASPSGDGASLCADLGGAGTLANTFTHSLGGNMAGGDIRARQRLNGTARLPGYAGAANDTAAVSAYLIGRNALVNSPPATATAESTGFAGGGACPQPSP